MITVEDLKKNAEVIALIEGSQKQLYKLGYTEHGTRHTALVSSRAGKILSSLDYDKRRVELAQIAGYLHDIGNSVNRVDHSQSGAILAYNLLKNMGMNITECVEVMTAIGNHDEEYGNAVSDISAALILADKSDVSRTRVRKSNINKFDIHDRVNYAVEESFLTVDKDNKKITLDLNVDTEICSVLDYFEIFMERTIMSKRAASFLEVWFELNINGIKLL